MGIVENTVRKFPKFEEHFDEMRQECFFICADIFSKDNIRKPLCLLKVAYRNGLITYVKNLQKISDPLQSLDELVGEDEDLSRHTLIGKEDEYFPTEIDYSIFTDEENALIDKILRWQRWVKDKIYVSVRNKLVDYFGGEFNGRVLTYGTKVIAISKSKSAEYRARIKAEGGEAYERWLARNREKYARNRERVLELNRRYYQEHRERKIEYQQAYQSRPEKVAERKIKYQERKARGEVS